VVAAFLYFLALGLLTPTLPRFVADALRGGPLWAGLAVGAFTLGALAFRPAIGPLARRFGSRAALQVGVSLVAISLGGLTAAQNPQIVVGLRLLMGCGEAMFFVTASAAVFQLATAVEARKAQALFSASVYVAFIVGPAIGESIRVALGYGPIWLVAALLAATSLIAIPTALTLEVPVADTSSRPEAGALRATFGPAVAMSALIVPMVGFTTFIALYGARIGVQSVQAPFIVFASTVLLLRTVGAGFLELVPSGRPLGVLLSAGAAGAVAIIAAPTMGGLILAAMLVGVSQSVAYPMLLTMAVNRAGPSSSLSAVTLFTGAFDAASGLGIVGLAIVLEATNFQVLFGLIACVGLFGAALASRLESPSRMDTRPQALA
jgi:predicted MFS family arabinose efflux permease